MQQLTPQDAVFLSMETPKLPAHIGGLAFLAPSSEAAFDFETFSAFIENRLRPIARFSWRLQEVPFGLDRPYWVRGEDFETHEHLHCIRLPGPYSHESLSRLVGRLFERPLDRGRPLWDMVLIEGLPGGRRALLWRTHHCLMDGAAGANLVEQIFDVSPDNPLASLVNTSRVDDGAHAGQPIATGEMLDRAVRNAAQLPLRQSKFLAKALRGLWKPDPPETRTNRAKQGAAPSVLAPRTSFNAVVGRHRCVAWSRISLDEVKRIKSTLGVTVNDVVLGITSDAMRSFLSAKGELPKESLIASIPYSTRSADDVSMGNQVQDLPIRWATDIDDPIERLAAIHASASEAKASARAGEAFDLIGMMGEAFLPGALNLFMRGAAAAGGRVPLPANAVVSNVPMAPFPLYCAGARVEQVIPISLLAPTQGLNITVLSYCGELHFGIVHDPELVPDAWDLAGRIPKSLQSLQRAVDQQLGRD